MIAGGADDRDWAGFRSEAVDEAWMIVLTVVRGLCAGPNEFDEAIPVVSEAADVLDTSRRASTIPPSYEVVLVVKRESGEIAEARCVDFCRRCLDDFPIGGRLRLRWMNQCPEGIDWSEVAERVGWFGTADEVVEAIGEGATALKSDREWLNLRSFGAASRFGIEVEVTTS